MTKGMGEPCLRMRLSKPTGSFMLNVFISQLLSPLEEHQFLENGHMEIQLSAIVMGNDFRALSIYLGLWVIESLIDRYWVLFIYTPKA